MREDRAGKELVVAKRERDSAEARLNEHKQKLIDFQKEKDARRDRLYATVLHKIIKREQLDRLKEELAKLDEEEMLLAEAVKTAEKELADKTAAADKAHTRFVIESKNLMKIQSHKNAWVTEEAKEQERIQDSEMEEFTGKRNTNDNYDDFN